uniref:Uncharacterized protein n=1 Tax=Arundo donax TaxID=35708 RepID=A0A0A9DUL9_ARUDO
MIYFMLTILVCFRALKHLPATIEVTNYTQLVVLTALENSHIQGTSG